MKVTGHACDVCDKYGAGVGEDNDPPGDWYLVIRHGVVQEVCSSSCLCKLGKETVALEKAQPPAGGHVYPVPECQRKFKKPQGLSMHMTHIHGGDD